MTRKRLSVSKSGQNVVCNDKITLPTELLIRSAPTQPYDIALNEAQAQLAIAKAIFEQKGDGGALGVYNAILSVTDFFASQGLPRALLSPLSAVAEAMIDADQGASNPLLQRRGTKKIGAPVAPIGQLLIEGQLAVITECCVRHFKQEGAWPYLEPAAAEASRLVKQSDWPIDPTSTNMREIRERVRGLVGAGAPDRIVYDMLLSTGGATKAPLEYAKRLLTSPLTERFPDTFLQKS